MPSVVQYVVGYNDRSIVVDVATLYPNIRLLSLRLNQHLVSRYLKTFDSQEFKNGDRRCRLEAVELGKPGIQLSTTEATLLQSIMEEMIERRERGSGLKLQIRSRYEGSFILPLETLWGTSIPPLRYYISFP